jgi:uncharacterized membrane protein YdjX (TVP38/TMEM64 family)
MKHWIYPLVIAIALFLMYYFSILDYFTISNLKKNQATLIQLTSEHRVLSPIVFVLIYALSVSLLLPFGIYLSLLGGFLFPHPFSDFYIMTGVISGCSTIYLVGSETIRKLFIKMSGPKLKTLEKAFQANAANYLLFLRLIPVSPGNLINLAAVLFGVRLWTFLWTAVVGMLPQTIVFASIGRELSTLLESKTEIHLRDFLGWDIYLLLIGLAALSLLPVFIKKTK